MSFSAGGAAAGAQAGSALGPWGTAAGALMGGLMGGGASASPAGPSILDVLTSNSADHSGWTVATGGSKANATSSKAEAMVPGWAQLAIGGVILIVLVRMVRK